QGYRLETIAEYDRTPFQSPGIRLGNFVLFADIGNGLSVTKRDFNDYAPRTTEIRHEIGTRLELQSRTARHLLNILVDGQALQYEDRNNLRYFAGNLAANWRIDVTHTTSIFGSAGINVRPLDNIDDENPKAASEPGKLTTTGADIGVRYTAGRIDAAIGIRYQHMDFADVAARDGSVISNSWQNNSALQPYIKGSWRFTPGFEIFGEVSTSRIENTGDSFIDRDANAVQGAIGVRFEASPVIRVMLKGGYIDQNYRQANLQDISAPIWECRLDWLVTPLVTLSFATWRDVRATRYGSASGQLVTGYSVSAEYEMWRNLVLSANTSFRDHDFIGIARKDRVVTAGLGAKYLYSRHWEFTAGYEHQELTSNQPGQDQRLDRFRIGANYRF
ncbi:MAG: outer membrane beta-barrel protein, partial [Hyphomicrobiaceae bacterium]